MAAAPAQPHSLLVRVFRAARPEVVAGPDTVTVVPTLRLPHSFGELHLGERFAALVVIGHDGASAPVDRPTLLVELETPSRTKLVLSPLTELTSVLHPGQSFDIIAECELKEAGGHALVVTVNYGSPSTPEPVRTCRRVFRFNVTNTLSVRTKVHGVTADIGQLSSRRETSYLEVQLSNTSTPTLHFERFEFDVHETMVVQGAASNDRFRLEGGSIKQHLVALAPREAPSSSVFGQAQAGGVLPLGRLDLGWRSAGGDVGRLQTSSLIRKMPPPSTLPAPSLRLSNHPSDLELAVDAVPAAARPLQPFAVVVRLTGTDLGAVRLEAYVTPVAVAEQVSAALTTDLANDNETRVACLRCHLTCGDSLHQWRTEWLATAAPGEVVSVGGLRAVHRVSKQVLREWPILCQVWVVHAVSV